MYCQTLLIQKLSTLTVRSLILIVLVFLLWSGIADLGHAQVPVDVVQVPVDVQPASPTKQYFEVDNDHTSLLFAVSHAGLSYTYGRFEKCSGQILLEENLDDTYFRFEIDVASINTNSRLRDDHLRGPEFFDTEQYSKITFASTDVKRDEANENYVVTGTMSMHGVERKVEMPITMVGIGKGPMGKTRGGFIAKFTIQRSDFGIDAMPKVIGDQIAITFSFEGVLKDNPPEAENQSSEKK
jgi:polyisoprenoid-binding protein YceI